MTNNTPLLIGIFVFAVSFSPDGKTIATASNDRTVKLWNQEGTLY